MNHNGTDSAMDESTNPPPSRPSSTPAPPSYTEAAEALIALQSNGAPSTNNPTTGAPSTITKRISFHPQTNGSPPKRPRFDRHHGAILDSPLHRIVPTYVESPQQSSNNVDNNMTNFLDAETEEATTTDASSVAAASLSTPPTRLIPAPPLVPFAEIPADNVLLITAALKDIYNIDQPRDFQIEAIHHLAFNDDTALHLIRKTADGKSLVPLGVAALRCAITLVLVPLVGLGSDQVGKAINVDHNLEAYHIDEHKREDAKLLCSRLLSMSDEEAKHITTLLYLSPQALSTGSQWLTIMKELARKGRISMFVIDEAHYVEQAGRSFRKEFVHAVEAVALQIFPLLPRPIPHLYMSASYHEEDRARVTRVMRKIQPNLMHGSLSRRGTVFSCQISGGPTTSMRSSAERDLRDHPTKQQIWFTNSRMNAEGSLLDAADSLLEANQRRGGPSTVARSFTGHDGIKMKTTSMDLFTGYTADDAPSDTESIDSDSPIIQLSTLNRNARHKAATEGTAVDNGNAKLHEIQILCATKSAECGISSNHIDFGYRKNMPQSLYDILQEMGRVNRRANALPGSCFYEVHISFDSVVSRIDHCRQCKVEQRKQPLHIFVEFCSKGI